MPGADSGAADATLDDLLAPQGLPAPLRAVMRAAGGVLEKVLPFDPRAYRAEKLGPQHGAIRAAAWLAAQKPGRYSMAHVLGLKTTV